MKHFFQMFELLKYRTFTTSILSFLSCGPSFLQDDQKSAAVQQLNISVKSSYGKFKGKTLDNKDIGEYRSRYRGAGRTSRPP